MCLRIGGCWQGWFRLTRSPWKPPCCTLHLRRIPPTFCGTSSQAHVLAMSLTGPPLVLLVVLPSQSWILHWCSDSLFCSCVAGASKAICWYSSFYSYIWWLKGKLALFIIVWFMDVLELKLHSFCFCSKTETPFLYLTSNRAQGPILPSTAWARAVCKLLIIHIALFTVFFCSFGCKFWICRLCSKTKLHRLDRFHGDGPYCKILTKKEPIKADGFAEDWVWHVIIYVIILEQSRQIQHLQPRQRKKVQKLLFFTLKVPAEAKKIEIFPKFQWWMKKMNIFWVQATWSAFCYQEQSAI